MTAEKWVDALGVTFGIIYFVRFWCEIVGSHKNKAGGTSSPRGSSGMKHMSLDTSDEKLETKGLLFLVLPGSYSATPRDTMQFRRLHVRFQVVSVRTLTLNSTLANRGMEEDGLRTLQGEHSFSFAQVNSTAFMTCLPG